MLGWLRRALARLSVLLLGARFVLDGSGRAYGVGRVAKLALASRLFRNAGAVTSLTTLQQQFILVREILGIPASLPGVVVECGCYEGGSTIALSLACAMVGRLLFVCDSFAGLPDPRAGEAVDVHPLHGTYYQWEGGDFRSTGGLEGVRRNVERYGDIDACRFVPGFYGDTLPRLPAEAVVMVYEDADLASSVEDCVKHLWPKLQPGCKFYCQEPWSIPVVGLFYDQRWWEEHLRQAPPGFYGSGGGVDYALSSSGMGFAIKMDPRQIQGAGRRILHAGLQAYRPS
jgi:O-methyltransferase